MNREIYTTKIEDKAYFYLYLYKRIFGKSTMLITNYPNPNPKPHPNPNPNLTLTLTLSLTPRQWPLRRHPLYSYSLYFFLPLYSFLINSFWAFVVFWNNIFWFFLLLLLFQRDNRKIFSTLTLTPYIVTASRSP